MVKRILQFPITRILLGVIFCIGSTVLVKQLITQPLLYRFLENKELADTIKNCLTIVVLLCSYYFFAKIYEKRIPTEIRLASFPREMGIGLLIGFTAISISIGLLHLMGFYHVSPTQDSNYSLKLFTLLCAAALVEDLLIRGLLIRSLENWQGTYVALTVGLLFESLHLFNPNSNLMSGIMVIVWGFTMTLLYVYSKSVWLPLFFHIGWNFSQPFYGSNLTGVEDMGRILNGSFSGPNLLTGGRVGIEGSLITIMLLFLIGILFYYLSIKSDRIIHRKKLTQ